MRFYSLLLVALFISTNDSFLYGQTAASTFEITSGSKGNELPTASAEEVGMSSEKLAKVKLKMQAIVEENEVAGVIAIVARHGKVVLYESTGWADIKAKEPLQNDSIMRFYSMTKAVTSVAIMMLVEEEHISLDDPISKYLPEMESMTVKVTDSEEELNGPITVRDLLRHTSGLTYDNMYSAFETRDNLNDAIDELSNYPLVCQPSTKFVYGVSSDVLGCIVERVSNKTLDDFFTERIFVPLDMRDTAFYVPAMKADRFVHNYGPKEDGKGLQVIDNKADSRYLSPPKMYMGGEGLVSTARDYLRFCVMLLNEGELNGIRLLSAETVKDMSRNQLPEGAYPIEIGGKRPGVGFGLGFDVVVEQTDHTGSSAVGDFGWGGAASTHYWMSPKHDMAVVLLSQYMPYSNRLEDVLKPLIYDAITDQ